MQVRFFFFKSFSEIFAQLRALLEGTTECRISEISDGALESQAGEDPPANKDADEEDNRGTCLDPRLTELPDEDAESAILWTANFPVEKLEVAPEHECSATPLKCSATP